jgi:hypothetical protein
MREGQAVAEGRKRQVVSDEPPLTFFATGLWLDFLGSGDWPWSTPDDRQGKVQVAAFLWHIPGRRWRH